MEQVISPRPKKAPARARRDITADDERKLNTEILLWILSITASLAAYLVIALLITNFYHPDIQALEEAAKNILAKPDAVRPEPVEAMLFRVAVVTLIPGTVLFYSLLSRIMSLHNAASSLVLLVTSTAITVFAIMVYLDFAAPNPFAGDAAQNKRDSETVTNFDYYFGDVFLLKHIMLYALGIVPLVAAAFFFGAQKYQLGRIKLLRSIASASGYLLAAGCLVAVVMMNTFHFPYTNENKYDFDAVYYSMTQVYSGAPMLVNHFTNTYGLYPHFLNPLFELTGLSVFSFSLVMALLTGLCFALNLFFLRSFTQSRLILFLGFFSVLFFPYLDFKLTTTADSIFSFYPIRYLAPSVLGAATVWYLRRSSRLGYWSVSGIMAAFILWNPEIGMVCYVAWTAVNIYSDFYTPEGSVAVRKIFGHLLSAAIAVCIVFGLYEVLMYATYGALPDLGLLFSTMFVFGKIGFGLLPMTLIHPWNIVAIILLLGFTHSGIKWYKKTIAAKDTAIFLTSILGLGYFAYFQGRSHNANLALSSGCAIMVLTLLGDELWAAIKKHSSVQLNAFFIVFLFLVSFSAVEVLFNVKHMAGLAFEEDNKAVQLPEQQRVESNADFIVEHSEPKQKIYVFTSRIFEGLYFGGSKRIAASMPGCTDLFLKNDVERLEQNIIDSSFTVFIEPWTHIYTFWERPFAAVAAGYDFTNYRNSMAQLTKRRYKLLAKQYFATSPQTLLHRKYDNDAAGLKMRVNDAFGIKPVTLQPEWSVQLLFAAQPQIFDDATLISNLKGGEGFCVENVLGTTNYRFRVSGKGYRFAVPPKGWVYCVINVYPDHFDVYENATLAARVALPAPVPNSDRSISVGNRGSFHNFLGPIAELELSNGTISEQQIYTQWNQLRQDCQGLLQ